MQLNPLTKKKIDRFRSIKRGYYSFILFTGLVLLSLIAELFVSNRALMVTYEGQRYFPTYGDVIPGTEFGLEYQYETNYRDLKKRFEEQGSGNEVILPVVPFNPFETDFMEGSYPPSAPDAERGHYLGTDKAGRDVLARLVYGFRIAIFFSLLLLLANYGLGVSIGCAMGYFGGKFDILFQRLIEIWSNIPFIYVVMIVASIVSPSFWSLIVIMVVFGWINMTWYMRTATFKEKAREYASAAKSIGCGDVRVMFHHILPNAISIIVTFIPFSISSGIVLLTSLDYLGFGLPPPTPSWGELLQQGTDRMDATWIVSSVVIAMVVVLTMVTFIGEAIREAFDPKKHTTYE